MQPTLSLIGGFPFFYGWFEGQGRQIDGSGWFSEFCAPVRFVGFACWGLLSLVSRWVPIEFSVLLFNDSIYHLDVRCQVSKWLVRYDPVIARLPHIHGGLISGLEKSGLEPNDDLLANLANRRPKKVPFWKLLHRRP